MFVGPNFQLKRKFVTIQDLKQKQLDKKKSATREGDKQMSTTNGSELKKINTNEEEILIPTQKEKVGASDKVFFVIWFC